MGCSWYETGWPFDVAFSLERAEQRAWVIVFGELAGRRWDYEGGHWSG